MFLGMSTNTGLAILERISGGETILFIGKLRR
ncbi:UNVERIFIED_CONTAM: hypothetical protein GTU68_053791 [Idotea baltica]|nr:hypothetical protein [Idotea baltica]